MPSESPEPVPAPPDNGRTMIGTAYALMRSFSGQPVLFGFLLLNFAFLAVIYFSVRDERAREALHFQILLEHCVKG